MYSINVKGIQYQFSSVAQSCSTLYEPMNRSTPGLPVHHNSRSSPRLTSIESVMPSSHLILCCPLFLLPPIPPSIRVFSNESTFCMRWPKYWSFSFSIIPSKEMEIDKTRFFCSESWKSTLQAWLLSTFFNFTLKKYQEPIF